jgi:hypothetical protein
MRLFVEPLILKNIEANRAIRVYFKQIIEQLDQDKFSGIITIWMKKFGQKQYSWRFVWIVFSELQCQIKGSALPAHVETWKELSERSYHGVSSGLKNCFCKRI